MQNRVIDIVRTESTPTEPLTLTEVKAHLRITITTDDTELTSFITRIRKRAEDYCNISIVTKTIVVICDLYKPFKLPYEPITTLTSVEYRSTPSDSYETLTANDDYNYEGGELQSFRCGRHKITYTAGMTVPDNLKLAILEEIAYHYENKGEETNKFAGEQIGFSKGAESLLEPFKVLSWT